MVGQCRRHESLARMAWAKPIAAAAKAEHKNFAAARAGRTTSARTRAPAKPLRQQINSCLVQHPPRLGLHAGASSPRPAGIPERRRFHPHRRGRDRAARTAGRSPGPASNVYPPGGPGEVRRPVTSASIKWFDPVQRSRRSPSSASGLVVAVLSGARPDRVPDLSPSVRATRPSRTCANIPCRQPTSPTRA